MVSIEILCVKFSRLVIEVLPEKPIQFVMQLVNLIRSRNRVISTAKQIGATVEEGVKSANIQKYPIIEITSLEIKN